MESNEHRLDVITQQTSVYSFLLISHQVAYTVLTAI